MVQRKFQNGLKYALVFLYIAYYGIPFFRGDANFLILFAYSLFCFFYCRKNISKFISLYIGGFFFIMLLQVIGLGYLDFEKFIGQLLRIFIAYMVLKVCEDDFIDRFLRVLLLLVYISFPFYLISLINNGFPQLLVSFARQFIEPLEFDPNQFFVPHFIVFTFREVYRNSGPFWEPGGYALILNFAIILNTIKERNVFNKTNILFIVALLTTMSTGGVISFFTFIVLYYLITKRLSYISFVLPLVLLIFYYAYNKYEFLGEKIGEQVIDVDYEGNTNTRSVSAYKDWQTIVESPLFGKGLFIPLKHVWSNENDEYRNNGTTNFLASWGFIGFLLFFIVSYYSFLRYCRWFNYSNMLAISIVIVVLIINSNEMVLGISPLSWCFSFMFFVLKPWSYKT